MKRILLKLSGEALAGAEKKGFDEATVIAVAKQIRTIVEEGTQVGIVIGGGNFWRGRTSETIDRNKADQIGMLATVMNCIYVSDNCRYLGLRPEIFTPFECGAFTSLYSKDAVEEGFAQGKVLFFAGGTGHPYFSTDTATVLRAVEFEDRPRARPVTGVGDLVGLSFFLINISYSSHAPFAKRLFRLLRSYATIFAHNKALPSSLCIQPIPHASMIIV